MCIRDSANIGVDGLNLLTFRAVEPDFVKGIIRLKLLRATYQVLFQMLLVQQ